MDGFAEPGEEPRPMRTAALARRALLARPGREEDLERLAAVEGRDPFRPAAPAVLTLEPGHVLERCRGPLRRHGP